MIALTFGAVVTISMALFQTYNRQKTLTLNQKRLNKRMISSISVSREKKTSETLTPVSRANLKVSTDLVLNNQFPSNIRHRPPAPADEVIINEVPLPEVLDANIQTLSQTNQSLEEKANNYYNKRLEAFIVEKNGLPYSVCELIIENKNNLYQTLEKNNSFRETQGNEFVNQLNKDTEKLYHDDLKRVLGTDFFSIFSQWNEKQEADISESMSGGRALF